MISSSDKAVLEETFQNSKMAAESIQTILRKVYDNDLSYDLNDQLDKYKAIHAKAADKLVEAGIMPEKRFMDKAALWSSIQLNTLLNTSTEHVVDMLIRGNAKSRANLAGTLNNNKNARLESCELALELMNFEEESIRRLKSFL